MFIYVFVITALVNMFKNYNKQNWAWLAIMIISIPLGVAPFIAIAYLIVFNRKNKNNLASTNKGVVYNQDGSYIVYKPEDTAQAPSTARVAFKVLIGIIFATMISYGLLLVGIIILIATKPSGSKYM
jgi:hypothetical protein